MNPITTAHWAGESVWRRHWPASAVKGHKKNKAHGGPVAPAQFSTEMALNDLESIGESIVMVENGFVR